MHVRRGLVPPALVTSSIVLVLCCLGWGALGVVAIDESLTLDAELYRFLTITLATATICSVLVNLFARLVRTIRHAHGLDETGDGESYADGYAAGLAAAPVSPGVSRLVPTRR